MSYVCRPSAVVLALLSVLCPVVAMGPLLTSADAASTVSIRVWPIYAIAPATLRVQVVAERSPQNRAMRIAADSQEYFSSSEVSLEGTDAPRVRIVTFRGVPAGEYELVGEVIGEHGTVLGQARAKAVVYER